jgi:hypothetical protein
LYENFDENEIAEEGDGSRLNGNNKYLQARNNKRSHTDSKRDSEQVPQHLGQSDYIKDLSRINFELLEESQEVIEFQTESKDHSIMEEKKSDELSQILTVHETKLSQTNLQLQTEPKEEVKQYQNNTKSANKKTVPLRCDSPGPRRATDTQSIEKKEIVDEYSQDQIFSDDMSDSSGDILQNPCDVKMMAPYDQRKELGPEEVERNKKLNIMYEELEDSGSDGSGPANQEDPNHLASIIEEDDEATDYQRSRSRSKSGTISPAFDNPKYEVLRSNNRPSDAKPLFVNHHNADLIDEDDEAPAKHQSSSVKNAKEVKKDVKKEIVKPKLKKKPVKKKDFEVPKPSVNLNEIQSNKSASMQHDEKNSNIAQASVMPYQLDESEKANVINLENSVKLDEHEASDDPPAPEPQIKVGKTHSPRENSKAVRKVEPEKVSTPAFHGPKQLKLLFTMLQDIGEEKTIIFSEFLHFYIMVYEIAANKRISTVKTLTPIIERMTRNAGKPETNIPHFLWAFMNPDRQEVLRKKTLRDIIKSCYDKNSKGRKTLLDSLEETIRHNERDSVDTQKNIRLTFNYPGTKRALINFANTISKIDSRISLAKDVSIFVASSIRETFLFNNEFFKDPIQGIETGPVYQEEPVEPMQHPVSKSHNRYYQYEEPNDLSQPGNFIILNV